MSGTRLWSRTGFLKVWHGEIGLYRAAYGLGGIGFILLSLVGDVVVDAAASRGGFIAIFAQITYAAAQIGFSVIAAVATWRAAHRRKPNGRRYGPIAIGLAFLFVGLQLLLTIAWVGLSTLGGSLGTESFIDELLGLSGANPEATEKLRETLGIQSP